MAEPDTPKTISVNGAALAYIERGAGDPLIFVHGSLGDYRTWGQQLEPFARSYRVIAYSRRYHFPNPWTGSGTDYTVGLHADDLTALIEALGYGPAYLVGNSFGAYTALTAAARRPDLVRKVAAGEPPILPWLKEIPGGQGPMDEFLNQAWNPAAAAFQQGDLPQGVRLFINGVSGPGSFDRAPEPARRVMLENARELQAEMVSPDYFTGLTMAQAAQIQTPILLLTGERSPKMFHLIVDRLAECLPHAQHITIPNASHAIPSGNPAVYNQTVMAFFEGQGA